MSDNKLLPVGGGCCCCWEVWPCGGGGGGGAAVSMSWCCWMGVGCRLTCSRVGPDIGCGGGGGGGGGAAELW